jgi:uncharacterized ferritin-like protein (DUF455 family)
VLDLLNLLEIMMGFAHLPRPSYRIYRFTTTTRIQSIANNAVENVSWDGLHQWRANNIDERLWWNPESNAPELPPPSSTSSPPPQQLVSLAEGAKSVLLTAEPLQKAAVAHQVFKYHITTNTNTTNPSIIGTCTPPSRPSRPPKPTLLPQRQIPSQKDSGLPLNAYLLHNLAHIECNAIDLAMDTVARFSHLSPDLLPPTFFSDFARVADDESRHLTWCLQRLAELGYNYGDMPAHDLLWEGAEASGGDIASRLAVVPMSQEARGLDAGERLAERLVGCGDNVSAAIVGRIAEEEKAHVAVGVTWFVYLHRQILLDDGDNDDNNNNNNNNNNSDGIIGEEFRRLVDMHAPGLLKPPFNHKRRQEVGLPREWYDGSVNSRNGGKLDELKKRLGVMMDMEASRV